MNMRYVLLALASATILSACEAEQPGPEVTPAATAEEEPAAVEDFPDLIIPENE